MTLRERLTVRGRGEVRRAKLLALATPGSAESGGLPPLAQVGVTNTGEIFSYINTLYFIQKAASAAPEDKRPTGWRYPRENRATAGADFVASENGTVI
ncbi:MAG: hypothetical protein A2W34_08015 [Chloroflexi bacterium RBG_16_64_32]|nr:MAG: hypothetical protein A2W34_08015 [Chloroflexi bacterium RBG_16_64_32]